MGQDARMPGLGAHGLVLPRTNAQKPPRYLWERPRPEWTQWVGAATPLPWPPAPGGAEAGALAALAGEWGGSGSRPGEAKWRGFVSTTQTAGEPSLQGCLPVNKEVT